MPKRFQKDIVKAATNGSSRQLYSAPGNTVSAEGIEIVLRNIGAGHRMSRSEIEFIIREVGGSQSNDKEGCVISADQMLDLISMK